MHISTRYGKRTLLIIANSKRVEDHIVSKAKEILLREFDDIKIS